MSYIMHVNRDYEERGAHEISRMMSIERSSDLLFHGNAETETLQIMATPNTLIASSA